MKNAKLIKGEESDKRKIEQGKKICKKNAVKS